MPKPIEKDDPQDIRPEDSPSPYLGEGQGVSKGPLGEDQEADGQYRRLGLDVGHAGVSRKSLDLGEDQEVSRESLDLEIRPVLALVTATQERNEAYFRKLLDTQRSIKGAIGDIYREGIQAEGETLLRIWLEIERSRS